MTASPGVIPRDFNASARSFHCARITFDTATPSMMVALTSASRDW